MWKENSKFKDEALAMKRAIHRQYGNSRHCHGVALFVDVAWVNASMKLIFCILTSIDYKEEIRKDSSSTFIYI